MNVKVKFTPQCYDSTMTAFPTLSLLFKKIIIITHFIFNTLMHYNFRL